MYVAVFSRFSRMGNDAEHKMQHRNTVRRSSLYGVVGCFNGIIKRATFPFLSFFPIVLTTFLRHQAPLSFCLDG